MKTFSNGFRIGFLLSTVIGLPAAALVGLLCWADSATCASKANAMHVASSWGPMQGCVIEFKPGQFVPLENYRVME